jgi:hypothetical protein
VAAGGLAFEGESDWSSVVLFSRFVFPCVSRFPQCECSVLSWGRPAPVIRWLALSNNFGRHRWSTVSTPVDFSDGGDVGERGIFNF